MNASAHGVAAAPAPPAQIELSFAPDAAGCTRVTRRRVRYPYAFLKPFWFGDRPPGIATAIVQSASGGLFAGERLGQNVTVAAGGAVHVTTQAAAIVHAATGKPATEQNVRLQIEEQGLLEYAPEPMVLFPGARLTQQISVRVAAHGVLVYSDGFVRHDPAADDLPFAGYRSDLEVFSPDGAPLFADRMEIDGSDFDDAMQRDGKTWRACGTIAVVAPAQGDTHASLCAALNEGLLAFDQSEVYAAAAALPNAAGVLCRIVARRGAGLRAALERGLGCARLELTGAPPPRRRK